ncbi:hypothetical protein KC19_9G058600 [Ceratodon purpureus]|uniref:Uncharacterized protein n=1 Tax=Ceratodon purpureus TaxID=3225 RepID=A0A8T0GSL7_CERPU|nr:hypothetical protein KC19_9G058600 [Ceratodon purpureus]
MRTRNQRVGTSATSAYFIMATLCLCYQSFTLSTLLWPRTQMTLRGFLHMSCPTRN